MFDDAIGKEGKDSGEGGTGYPHRVSGEIAVVNRGGKTESLEATTEVNGHREEIGWQDSLEMLKVVVPYHTTFPVKTRGERILMGFSV
ncbi:hypothetical protein [Natronorubrum daqingense]|uniref:hypothetical protein n=1 Tax=Natronorubrum daqingense TaxID=588898 RepID=UPI0011156DD3|nr:hypothetical protein [Natronorubrum daqingense]